MVDSVTFLYFVDCQGLKLTALE